MSLIKTVNMQSVALLLIGIQLVYSGQHSLQYFYTATSGLPNFPQFVTVGIVDGQPFTYYDSNIRRETPRQEWMAKSVGEDYWEQQTQVSIGSEQSFMNNINVAKDRFNQTGGVHTFQFMYGCELDEDGSTRGYLQYGYDGEDFISFDKTTQTNIAASPQAFITKTKWDDNKAQSAVWKSYLDIECIEWVKKYVGYGKDTLERKDAPEVFLLQKDPSSPVLCQATGFYPSNIMMTWQKNKEDHYEDVAVGTTLPNIDGTFQKTITLKPEEWENNKEAFRCVVQHVGAAEDIVVTVKDIRSNPGSDNTIAIVVGCLVAVAVAVLAAIVGRVFWKKYNGYGKASTKDSDSENSDQQLSKVTSK